jgi:Mn-dependent DtxR family transcriptional regulator
VFTAFLTRLGVPTDVVARDVEGLEHHLSSVSVEKIESLLQRLRSRH